MIESRSGSSVERVRAALAEAGHPDTITTFPDGTHTAAASAAALGCGIEAIAKSIVFQSEGRPVVVIVSGVDRVDTARVAAAIGSAVERADAAFIRATTGFAIGGVAPIGHLDPPVLLLDEALLGLDPVWAGAGSPLHVFRTSGAALARMTGATVARVRC